MARATRCEVGAEVGVRGDDAFGLLSFFSLLGGRWGGRCGRGRRGAVGPDQTTRSVVGKPTQHAKRDLTKTVSYVLQTNSIYFHT